MCQQQIQFSYDLDIWYLLFLTWHFTEGSSIISQTATQLSLSPKLLLSQLLPIGL